MTTSDFLRQLSRANVQSRVVNIPFLLKAHEEGAADEAALAPVAPLLLEELADFWIPPTLRAFLKELELDRRPVVSGTFIPRHIPPVDLAAERRRAEDALVTFFTRFPAAADVYRPWLERIIRTMDDAPGQENAPRIKKLFEFFEQSIQRERERQEHIEQQFWNGIYVAILHHVDPEGTPWLIGAHRFLNDIGGVNDPASTAATLEANALRIQIPILSAALAAGFKREGIAYDILQLGEQTAVKIAGEENAIVIDTPGFARLDVAWLAHDEYAGDSRLVSLPVGPAQLGHSRWREIMESPLFQAFSTKLVPSSLPFGIAFPKERPTLDDLELAVKKAFPDTPNGQRLRVRHGGIQRDGSYSFFIASETMRHRHWSEVASLLLTIVNGTVEAAEYRFPGLPSGHALSVVVDETRLAVLVVQGKRKAGGTPGSAGSGSFGGVEMADDETSVADETEQARHADETAAALDAAAPSPADAGASVGTVVLPAPAAASKAPR